MRVNPYRVQLPTVDCLLSPALGENVRWPTVGGDKLHTASRGPGGCLRSAVLSPRSPSIVIEVPSITQQQQSAIRIKRAGADHASPRLRISSKYRRSLYALGIRPAGEREKLKVGATCTCIR